MGAGMMVPVPFVLWTLGSAFFVLGLFLTVKAVAQWRLGRRLDCGGRAGSSGVVVGGIMLPGHAHAQLANDDDDEVAVEAVGGDVEMNGLLKNHIQHRGHGS